MLNLNSPDVIREIKEATRCQANLDEGNCPACGDPEDRENHEHFDQENVAIMQAHNDDDHSLCAYSI